MNGPQHYYSGDNAADWNVALRPAPTNTEEK